MNRLKKHINPATILALAALVFAITGGAYAASGGSGNGGGNSAGNASHATAYVAKAKKKAKTPAGKPGPRGPEGKQGPAGTPGAKGETGPTGPAGSAGAKGENGAAGSNGTNGTNGTNGESVKASESSSAIEGHCTGSSGGKGGSKFEVGGVKTYACNGKEGAPGAIHPGKNAGEAEALPEGATETGAWEIDGGALKGPQEEMQAVIASFPIPLAAALPAGSAHYINSSGKEIKEEKELSQTVCKGSAAEPTAEPGNLCVYEGSEEAVNLRLDSTAIRLMTPTTEEGTVSKTGARMKAVVTGEEARAFGSWAVTAPVA